MSQQNRRFLAAAGLAAALTLAFPSPSRAVGLREVGGAAALAVRAWAWLERLGAGVRPAPARRPSARWEKQGSAIDPNGAAARVATRTTASTADVLAEQGSAIDPNGLQ
jgi:hypothetical protein